MIENTTAYEHQIDTIDNILNKMNERLNILSELVDEKCSILKNNQKTLLILTIISIFLVILNIVSAIIFQIRGMSHVGFAAGCFCGTLFCLFASRKIRCCSRQIYDELDEVRREVIVMTQDYMSAIMQLPNPDNSTIESLNERYTKLVNLQSTIKDAKDNV